MKKPKFAVGDVVMLKSDITVGQLVEDVELFKPMKESFKFPNCIEAVDENHIFGKFCGWCYLIEHTDGFWYSESMLELAEETK